MTLTGNMKRQTVNVTFVGKEVQGERVITELKSVDLVPTSIKRKVGRNKDRLDDSFKCVTKDGVAVRIKPLLVTANKTSKPVKTDMRRAMVEKVQRTVATIPFDTLINDIIIFKFQKALKQALHKIYPLRNIDIRTVSREGTGDAPVLTAEEEKDTMYTNYVAPPPRTGGYQRNGPRRDFRPRNYAPRPTHTAAPVKATPAPVAEKKAEA